MDAMVTARLPIEKKKRGNEILASLGTTPSRVIGQLYDYLIAEGQVPDLSVAHADSLSADDRRKAYTSFLLETVLPIPESFWAPQTSDEDVLTAALEEKYGSLA